MKLKTSLFSLAVMFIANSSFAGWQSDGYYVRDSYYRNDGSKLVISLRGGLSLANAKMTNEVGSLDAGYYMTDLNGDIISSLAYRDAGSPSGYTDVGYGNIADLPVKEKFSKTAFAAGASLGFTVPYHQQWRLEAGYDHISETDYNATPLFEGDLNLTGAPIGDVVALVHSSGVSSTISTDVVSVMGFYDFFDGLQKPVNKIVPYIGVGVGYAMSKTTMKLSDIYGDLSEAKDLENFGTVGTAGVIQFDNPTDKDKYPTSNSIALLAGLGFAYGINENTYLDAGVRLMYIPKITWDLVNKDGSLHRSWFGAENMIYTNFMLGVRFEF